MWRQLSCCITGLERFLNSLSKRISDCEKMRDVCLDIGMREHHFASHFFNNPGNINGAAYTALQTWCCKNEQRGMALPEMFHRLKKASWP